MIKSINRVVGGNEVYWSERDIYVTKLDKVSGVVMLNKHKDINKMETIFLRIGHLDYHNLTDKTELSDVF